jgi:hypothetical protein
MRSSAGHSAGTTDVLNCWACLRGQKNLVVPGFALIDVKLTLELRCMKTLPKMEISDELDAHINEGTKLSELCKADVVRQALRIGLPQFAARFQPAPLWLEERIREALAEPAEPVTPAQFKTAMKAIADGR